MKVSALTEELFRQELSWLQNTIKNYLETLADSRLMQISYEVNVNGELYNSPFARRLRGVWEFAAGRAARPQYLKETLEQLRQILWSSPYDLASERGSVPPLGWENTGLGLMMMVAEARIKLSEGSDMTSMELALLGSVTRNRINQLINGGDLKAYRVASTSGRDNWLIKNEEAKKFLANR